MRRLLLPLALVAGLVAVIPAASAATTRCGAGQVYTQTNDPAGNQLVVLRAGRDGLLTQRQLVDTGGLGTGSHITSGGAVAVSPDGCRVAAVNAASGAVAVFAIGPTGRARFAGSASTGGTTALSVALSGDDLATLSTTPGGAATIRTFTLGPKRVIPVPGSLQAIDGATDGGQIAYTARGRYLVVTTRKSHGLVTFRIDAHVPTPAESLLPSTSLWPYGFALTAGDQAIVSFGDFAEPAASGYGSYAITSAGGITEVTAPTTGDAGACWVALAPTGDYAWGVDADAPAVATLSVSRRGAIAVTSTTASGATGGRDIAVSADGHFVYLLLPDTRQISTYRVGARGALALVGTSPTPSTAVSTGGIAAS